MNYKEDSLANSHRPLPSNFDLNDHINNNNLISEFYNFPFLRDQLFLSFIKTLNNENLENFEKFILSAQVEYFKKFINPQFNQESLKKLSKISNESKCPFAPRTKSSELIKPFSYEPISKVRYSFIENVHISDMKIDNLTINIVKPETERAQNPKFVVLLNGIHHYLNFNNPFIQYIMMPDTKISNTIPLIDDHCVNEILKVKPVLSSSDALFLFPEKVLVINSTDLDRFLNIIIYLNILKIPSDINVLKSIGLNYKSLPPSFLEPYSDILTSEFIQNNLDLFNFSNKN